MCRKDFAIIVFAFALIYGVAATDHAQCLSNVRNNNTIPLSGLLHANGTPITNRSDIMTVGAVSYDVCVQQCGPGLESFSWSSFSQEFSAWLLPYLALISQLPFGARYRPDNLMSALLTVGSPVLAGYSMYLTLLNARWVTQSFDSITYPNAKYAARVLSSLQQVPLRVNADHGLLSSLVVLPQNDDFWSDLADFLNYSHTWSIAAATSILWVVIAFIFTVADSLSTGQALLYSNGQGVGSIWLWLIPIVIGWLQLSPKCDYNRLQAAITRANNIAFVATPDGYARASSLSGKCAISIDAPREELSSPDEKRTPPVFNYARALSWARAAEDMLNLFRKVSFNVQCHKPVTPTEEWQLGGRDGFIDPRNRSGSLNDIQHYCQHSPRVTYGHLPPGVYRRMFLASLFPLLLQWGTTGGAALALWLTPTTGLGCRSLSYFIYGTLSTLVWILLVASSILGDYSTSRRTLGRARYHVPHCVRAAKILSNILRFAGKTLAIINAIGLIASSVFQFANVFDNCYCDGSVTGRGALNAYVILDYANIPNMGQVKGAWIGSVCLASICAIAFVGFINLLSDSVAL
ncbi:hypothetical protein BJ138DRAFT_341412 [Hygrophoropsis aurantiaca]|uniref:Uncharacterized protein n=1 Tax=Hygrophoropsis aurantiaca TaxID=72124 RepID=A0ACB8A781_9AGAM|nr:hypothetical protein BJ138DRAFT_341412 [Hygrophoropsis aurantiaca]